MIFGLADGIVAALEFKVALLCRARIEALAGLVVTFLARRAFVIGDAAGWLAAQLLTTRSVRIAYVCTK